MHLSKSEIIKLILVAGATASTAFFLYKLYKIGRDVNRRQIAPGEYKAAYEAVHKTPEHEVEQVETEEERFTEANMAPQMHPDVNPMVDPSEPPDDEEVLPYFDPQENSPLPPDDHEPDVNTIGVEPLRFDKDSNEALEQYKDMLLAGFDQDTNTYKTLRRLFDTPFEATNEKDDSIMQRVADRRIDFFGDDSKWIYECTMADVILDFAISADYDMDQGVEYWSGRIVGALGFNSESPQALIEAAAKHIQDCSYEHFTQGTTLYGLFSLDKHDMTDGINEPIQQQYWDWSSVVINEFM
jgi:hypothetical protein